LSRVRSNPSSAHQTEKPLHAPGAEHPTQGHEKSPYKPNKERVQRDGLIHDFPPMILRKAMLDLQCPVRQGVDTAQSDAGDEGFPFLANGRILQVADQVGIDVVLVTRQLGAEIFLPVANPEQVQRRLLVQGRTRR
jgi:hypothetical protein